MLSRRGCAAGSERAMRFFDGLERTDYQDLLRALGRECDYAALRDLRLIETDTGLTIQFRSIADLTAGFQTFRYDESELLALLQGTYALRGGGTENLTIHSPLGLHYQQMLRAVGRGLDQEGLHDLRFIEQPGGVLLQVSTGHLRRGFRTYRLTKERLHDLIAEMRSGTPAMLGPVTGRTSEK